jgi:hypothetical protein
METIYVKLGMPGRMISGSKSGYSKARPRNLVVFNSNLILRDYEGCMKVWHGDVDITIDRQSLVEIARDTGKDVLILREMHGRFENENNPLVEEFVYSVTPDGVEKLGKSISDYVDIETMEVKR